MPHCIVILPNSNGMQLLLCYDSKYMFVLHKGSLGEKKPLILDEGVYVNTYGKTTKNEALQWGEMPTSVGKRLKFSD